MNVDIDEDDSEEATVNSGVSQGTVLCRLHINDLPDIGGWRYFEPFVVGEQLSYQVLCHFHKQ